jgi:crotonobetainyl-CoA:carnitine CoA-transferase CaiB-like acyl-CoA transferase
MAMICDDLLVVELGTGSPAASMLGMFLADNGARVLKVEPPAGDRLRAGLPSAWLVWNRGKESVVLDLRSPRDRAEAVRLAGSADVIIDGLAPGRAGRYGLEFEQLKAANPSLVYCSITAFGRHGPYACVKGYEAVVQAKAGAFGRGAFAFRPGPIFNGAFLASNAAAQHALGGVMSALVVRDATGVGQRVDTTLWQGLGPTDYFMSYIMQIGAKASAEAAARGEQPKPVAQSASGSAATRYGVLGCTRDGRWLSFSTQLPHQARALAMVLGLEGMLSDPRFERMPEFSTIEDAHEWDRRILERIKERDFEEWVAAGLANPDLPFDAVLSAEQALSHPQIRHNGNVVVVNDPALGPIEQIGPIAAFSATPSVIRRSAPGLDEHGTLPEPRHTVARSVPGRLPDHPLSGLTIVEAGYFYAMPYGVALAAAMGARVIKIENVDGDPMRWAFGPKEWGGCKTMEGKESVALNLRHPVGQAVCKELITRADVFVQGFRPGVDARLGLDYETVRKIRPDIVYLHGSGYGPSGPYAHRPIYAGVAGALAGSVHRQAAYWFDRELAQSLNAVEAHTVIASRLATVTDGDANPAVSVFASLLLAVRHQRRTGQGQFVATSMIGGNVLAYSDDFNLYMGKEAVQQADPDQFGLNALYRLYEANPGWVFFAAPSDTEFATAVAVMGDPWLSIDPRFATAKARTEHDEALAGLLAARFTDRPATEWEEILSVAGVGCVSVPEDNQPVVSCKDPVLRETGLMVEIEHPLFGKLLRYAPPAALSETPGIALPGSFFAQHTTSVLRELGYSDESIGKFAADGAIAVA